jgi:hypothetical protein
MAVIPFLESGPGDRFQQSYYDVKSPKKEHASVEKYTWTRMYTPRARYLYGTGAGGVVGSAALAAAIPGALCARGLRQAGLQQRQRRRPPPAAAPPFTQVDIYMPTSCRRSSLHAGHDRRGRRRGPGARRDSIIALRLKFRI